MFVGSINSIVRRWLTKHASELQGKTIVVGCSGNFTSERTLFLTRKVTEFHSNDISLYSCCLGNLLTGKPVEYQIKDPELNWVHDYLVDDTHRCAAILVLVNLLQWRKQANDFQTLMWNRIRSGFGDLVAKTAIRIEGGIIPIASFTAGDFFDHFQKFEDREDAVFCCYAPTYKGGYEKLYKNVDDVIDWDRPSYQLVDESRRDEVLKWLEGKPHLWYDDRIIERMEPVFKHMCGRLKTVYIYSNAISAPDFVNDRPIGANPPPWLQLAGSPSQITHRSTVKLRPIKTSELAGFKDRFLGRAINFAAGQWAFAILIDGLVYGFVEFALPRASFGRAGDIYLQADFAVPGTQEKQLSKLIAMMTVSKDTKRLIERLRVQRIHRLVTTAFTNKPVSMKYRSVLQLIGRGTTKEGQQFLQYEGHFNDLTWTETLRQWQKKTRLTQSKNSTKR